jgi:hypothetical protein
LKLPREGGGDQHEMSRDLTLALTEDGLGDLVAKTPQGGMIAATTYLLSA